MESGLVYSITQGNPGAMTVLFLAMEQSYLNLFLFQKWGKYGSDLWVAYKEAGKDVNVLLEKVKKELKVGETPLYSLVCISTAGVLTP